MILLAESPHLLPPSSLRHDVVRSMEAARLTGWTVAEIPPDFSHSGDAEGALWHIPAQDKPIPTVWLGYIPDFERYKAIFEAAQAKNLILLNTPEEHRTIQEFDLAYPHLEGLTPHSATVDSIEAAVSAASQVGFPIFVKGAVQSRKSRGWKACVAEDEAELRELCSHLLDLQNRSRGRVVLREVVALRHSRKAGDFPMGREYRLFLLNGEILACGYYWEGDDPLKNLTTVERHAVEALAKIAARRLPAPYIAIDIGQKEDGQWIVIETGDPQFSGLSQIAPLVFWNRLHEALSNQ
jgi:glutathione synthase/RimK-type ligase-like ATP-grasp enzyme